MTNDMVEKICRVPLDFRNQNKSFYQLFEETGYLAAPNKLTKSAIEACLREHPDWVEAWLGWSADKRCSPPSWCFVAEGTSFFVWYYPDGERLIFADALEACAEFILREVGQLRD